MRLHHIAFPFAAIIAVFTLAQAAHANVMIIIDKSAQKMTVTVNGEDRYTWPVSTGRDGYDTPSGDHQPFRMEKDHFSREWDDAPMPNSIFFTKIGHAIHGTYEVRNLGKPASHGCVRLSTQNAATLYALVKDEGVFNTRVRLVGEIPKSSDLVASRDRGNSTTRESTRGSDNDTPRRSYVRNYNTDNADTDNTPPQQNYQTRSGRETQYSSRSYYYQQRPYPYYERRYYYGRGLFGSSGW
ncbi:MAG TPA: L,D-transpeptidase [Pseudolabrys sp.]|nr:L,D-transpeptidase [Pseudolabrys sp.]